MATITATGTVYKLHRTGNGFILAEPFTRKDGSTGQKRITVFPIAPAGVRENDTVTVSGEAGADGYIYEDKNTGEEKAAGQLVVNRATVSNDDSAPF
jgi:hypothetical protein